MKFKDIIKLFLPPIFIKIYKSINKTNHEYGFFGNYQNWSEAKSMSKGYDSELIFEKVKSSLLKVKNGEAVYERDSVIFDRIEYSWALLSALQYIYIREGFLNIIDFGGSLGSTYYQNKKFLDELQLSWNIVEQEKFVKCGKDFFEGGNLNFFFNIEDCLSEIECNSILFSSSLQYIEHPFSLLKEIINKKFKYIIFDRTPFFKNNLKNEIKIQKVDPLIYEGIYPSWIFNYNNFVSFFEEKYLLIEEFESQDKCNLSNVIFKGFIFVRK